MTKRRVMKMCWVLVTAPLLVLKWTGTNELVLVQALNLLLVIGISKSIITNAN